MLLMSLERVWGITIGRWVGFCALCLFPLGGVCNAASEAGGGAPGEGTSSGGRVSEQAEATTTGFGVVVRVVDSTTFGVLLGASVEIRPFVPRHLREVHKDYFYEHPELNAGPPISGRSPAGGGEYAFDLPQDGEYLVLAMAPGYEPGISILLLRSKEPSVHVVSLARGGTIWGKVIDGDGNPLEGAKVAVEAIIGRMDDLSLLNYSYPLPYVNPWLAVTSNDGRFELLGIPQARYVGLNARIAGYCQEDSIWVDMRWSDSRQEIDIPVKRLSQKGERSEPNEMTAEAPIETIRAAKPSSTLTVQLIPPELVGSSIGLAEKPPPFISRFCVIGTIDNNTQYNIVRRCVLEPRGYISMELAPGLAHLYIWVPGHGPILREPMLRDGEETMLLVPLADSGGVRGRVVCEDGRGAINGAVVSYLGARGLPRHLEPLRGGADMPHPETEPAPVATDVEGRYRFRHLPRTVGSYDFWARAPGFAPGYTRLSLPVGDKNGIHPVDIRLHPEGVIYGCIVGWHHRRCFFVGEKGESTPVFLKGLVLEHGAYNGISVWHPICSDGRFRIGELEPGNYRMSLQGYSSMWEGTGPRESMSIWSERITLEVGEKRELMIVPDVGYAVQGRLRSKGIPLSDVRVALVGSCRSPLFGDWLDHLDVEPFIASAGEGDAPTAGDGTFCLADSARGPGLWQCGQTRMILRFSDSIYLSRYAVLDYFYEKGRESVVDVEVPSCAIEGTIAFEHVDLNPRMTVLWDDPLFPTVEIASPYENRWMLVAAREGDERFAHLIQGESWLTGGKVKSESRGFRLEALPPGSYSLKVMSSSPHKVTMLGPIRLREGETRRGVSILVEKDPSRVNSVHLVLPASRFSGGVENLSLLVWPLLADPSHCVRLAPGRYWGIGDGQIFQLDIPTESQPYVVPAGDERGDLSVQVVSGASRTVNGAEIFLYHFSGLELLQLRKYAERDTDPKGQLWIHDVAAGVYSLEARWRDLRSRRVPVTVKGGQINRVVLAFGS